MAVLGHLVCHTCKEEMCLGKWLRDDKMVGYGFWRGGNEFAELGLKTLNFLARHVGHQVQLMEDDQFYNLPLEGYRSVEDELRSDWPADAERG